VGICEGREVAMVQSYGPEARGGASKAEIIISDSPIDYPLCTQVDLLLAMTQDAADAFCRDLSPKGLVIVDRDLVPHPPTSAAIALPLTAAARDRLKSPVSANVIALGVISEITDLVSRRSLEKVLLRKLSTEKEALNKKALSLGIRMAKKYSRARAPAEEMEAEAEDM
jgi:2-oxoglutarate ferredoxin oxidoreductase subunit gamma